MIELDNELYFLTPHSSNPECPLLVFLPGMDETGKELLYLETTSLEASFDVRCLVIPPNNFMTWEQLTESAIALIQAELENISQQTVYLCGESLGGCLALKLIERAPYLFKRLILVNSASSFHRVAWLNQSSRLLAWTPPLLYKLSPIVILCLTSALTRIQHPECCGGGVHFRALSSVVVSIEHFFLARTPSKQASLSSVPL